MEKIDCFGNNEDNEEISLEEETLEEIEDKSKDMSEAVEEFEHKLKLGKEQLISEIDRAISSLNISIEYMEGCKKFESVVGSDQEPFKHIIANLEEELKNLEKLKTNMDDLDYILKINITSLEDISNEITYIIKKRLDVCYDKDLNKILEYSELSIRNLYNLVLKRNGFKLDYSKKYACVKKDLKADDLKTYLNSLNIFSDRLLKNILKLIPNEIIENKNISLKELKAEGLLIKIKMLVKIDTILVETSSSDLEDCDTKDADKLINSLVETIGFIELFMLTIKIVSEVSGLEPLMVNCVQTVDYLISYTNIESFVDRAKYGFHEIVYSIYTLYGVLQGFENE